MIACISNLIVISCMTCLMFKCAGCFTAGINTAWLIYVLCDTKWDIPWEDSLFSAFIGFVICFVTTRAATQPLEAAANAFLIMYATETQALKAAHPIHVDALKDAIDQR